MSQNARLDEERATERRAQILGLEYIDTSKIPNKQLYKQLLSVQELYNLRLIPIVADEHNISFGITNTTSQQTIVALRQRFQDQRLNFSLISDTGYHDYMKLYDPPKAVVYEDIALNKAGSQDLLKTVSQTLEQVKADDVLAYLVEQAHRLNASDIHLECQRDHVRVRFRMDGVLHPIAKLSPAKYHILTSAIASDGNISTYATEPQQGHISTRVKMLDGKEVDLNLRLETVPSINGMDIVMRLFNLDQNMYNLDKLGLTAKERAVVDDIISKPSGLVLIVGPTGSGKTTTLYSMLNTLNNDERKVITIEDPVEYQFPGITQISVTNLNATKISFANELRAVLRLDPDIIMVGEIRDTDTARTALQASLTGHLVLSTFHASSASAALTRMMDVIGTNPLFVSAIRLVMAQRLVRRLDDKTKQPYQPDEATLKHVRAVIESLPDGIEKPDINNLKLFQPGKSEENPFGYSGQVAIREQFLMTGEIRKLLEQAKTVLSTQDIEAAAIKSGMCTIMQDGILKACQGITTIDEVFRVVD